MYVEISNVTKSYGEGGSYCKVLNGISTLIDRGQICVILGPSGSGKSTLLNAIGGLDTVDSGQIHIDGKEITGLKPERLSDYRRDTLGFVFQFYNLVPNLTAKENVELACQICKDPLDVETVLTNVGLKDRMNNFPSQLSGGEQQRVSIARALAKNPKLLLCDEPTGALDDNTGKTILKLLQDTCYRDGMTVILITHNHAITPMANRIITMKNSKVISNVYNENPVPIEQIEW